ncbi:hypothetical protein UFOVP1288_18 [uncultured Caudovirales phage]|uniref:Uncharacterized protein n=1 Tax=uncultured Caudovirales phage TaxID=2100421 RepID=A0A6J5RDA2_9CAUD|nr:hypothetical protein UFOVP1195_18 [uncultured Caudovirales phage]CAB4195480.1 hypothetical protein UFOVP1288_18 [uncultured Caudovirales phage]CAB4204919.1 hypothetical protein UFOVP1409_18 [uncultured Caudovirales phage]
MVPELAYTRWEEGAHAPLVLSGCKYSHHPIIAAQELSKERIFRHVPFLELLEAIREHGATRQSSQFYHLLAITVSLRETVPIIASVCGVSCLCCDSLALEPFRLSDQGFSHWRAYEARHAAASPQYKYVHLLTKYGVREGYPVLCPTCFALAQAGENPKYGAGYHDIYHAQALRGLISILENQAGATNVQSKKTTSLPSRSRRGGAVPRLLPEPPRAVGNS